MMAYLGLPMNLAVGLINQVYHGVNRHHLNVGKEKV